MAPPARDSSRRPGGNVAVDPYDALMAGPRQVSPEQYRRITLAAIVALGAIIVTGAAVRLTGSGLGCSDWPNCEDDRLVAPLEFHALVEFVNRLVTGVVSIAVILAVLGSLRRVPKRSDLTIWSLGLVAGVIAQIALGAVVVVFHLDPRLVIGHFLVSMVLLWNAVVLHHRAGHDGGRRRRIVDAPSLTLSRVLVAVGAVVLVTGTLVTGSGPHAGSTDEPIERLPFAVRDVARVHSTSVLLLLALTVALFWRLRRTDAPADPRAGTTRLVFVILGQGAIGYTQYFTDVPVLLVAAHIVGAVALWATLVDMHLRLFESDTSETSTADPSADHAIAVP